MKVRRVCGNFLMKSLNGGRLEGIFGVVPNITELYHVTPAGLILSLFGSEVAGQTYEIQGIPTDPGVGE